MFSHDPYASADKAVDGTKNRDMKQQSCISADTEDYSYTSLYPGQSGDPAWWYVDLQNEYDILEVRIVTRDSNPSDEGEFSLYYYHLYLKRCSLDNLNKMILYLPASPSLSMLFQHDPRKILYQ